ncbi:unnamed protein product [Aspergillus oryzae var. brunneus]|uniref:Unnamed protein product n=2 Tax=Aspergillus oryzae TaxID=5062 RepID=A0AAN4YXF9_ASPOZ|nr:unnamed protein product [Aspergillus oryzae]GMG45067.1 unnamed protein product [Aspergillus oryzae var. brunneus]
MWTYPISRTQWVHRKGGDCDEGSQEAVLNLTLGSRTADDGGGERAGSNGPDGSAPREGEGCALEEHCPGELGL